MKPERIAVLHCAACTGKDRRRDHGYLTRNHEGELTFHGYGYIKDERGYQTGVNDGPKCARHGELDLEEARSLSHDVIRRHEETRRVQHLPIPPTIT